MGGPEGNDTDETVLQETNPRLKPEYRIHGTYDEVVGFLKESKGFQFFAVTDPSKDCGCLKAIRIQDDVGVNAGVAGYIVESDQTHAVYFIPIMFYEPNAKGFMIFIRVNFPTPEQ